LQNGFLLADEKDNKGYYNVEKIKIVNNHFSDGQGVLLNLYRGGSDESTLGPDLTFINNNVLNYSAKNNDPLIQLTGVQRTSITNNTFSDNNASKTLIVYKDTGRANHLLSHNTFLRSGAIQKNDFVMASNNKVQ
jgi:poly(beta-D-mannuronate) lyase